MASQALALCFGGGDEEVAPMLRGEAFEKFTVSGCQSVVELVARCPEGIYR